MITQIVSITPEGEHQLEGIRQVDLSRGDDPIYISLLMLDQEGGSLPVARFRRVLSGTRFGPKFRSRSGKAWISEVLTRLARSGWVTVSETEPELLLGYRLTLKGKRLLGEGQEALGREINIRSPLQLGLSQILDPTSPIVYRKGLLSKLLREGYIEKETRSVDQIVESLSNSRAKGILKTYIKIARGEYVSDKTLDYTIRRLIKSLEDVDPFEDMEALMEAETRAEKILAIDKVIQFIHGAGIGFLPGLLGKVIDSSKSKDLRYLEDNERVWKVLGKLREGQN